MIIITPYLIQPLPKLTLNPWTDLNPKRNFHNQRVFGLAPQQPFSLFARLFMSFRFFEELAEQVFNKQI